LPALAKKSVVALIIASAVHAQKGEWPAKPVRMIVPFGAGGAADVTARLFADQLGQTFGQQFVVENRSGGGGLIGAQAIARGEPDGYTIGQGPVGALAITRHMVAKLPYDIERDLQPVAVVTTGYMLLAVSPRSEFHSVAQLVDFAKKNPGKIDYGSTGSGTTPHLAIEEFAAKAGIKLTHVPFKGSADLMTSILGGHIQSASDSTGWAPHVEAGKLRLLATYGSKRTKKWPDVPTLAELGYDTVSDSPFGIGGPPGMDPAVVKTLHDAFRTTLEDPKVLAILDRFDQSVIYMSSEEYTKYARQMVEAERVTIDRLGLRGSM
jgi:tripartite-type tricarboxylate transporter receptor subunit TctC